MLLSSYSGDPSIKEAGCDEAGRGCLAGPVVAAAVLLPWGYNNPRLNDSKQLTPQDRLQLREEIWRDALCWAVAEVDSSEIDRLNILNASFKAMQLAIDKLSVRPDLVLIDGNRFRAAGVLNYRCIVKGDATYQSIAAASVLAKTYRDEQMCRLAAQFPGYGWESNKGYPTPAHREAICRLGVTPYHRKSFQLLPAQLELFAR
ncbi:MAG: ribonuclease HII [Cyclobacteriaceae bacterium]|nr:MAG: ribonuclease HII [Cyclobacteriaceae bacterium]